jgi:hypothetical protein
MISNRLLGGKAIVMEMGSKVTFCKFHWNLTRKDQLSFKTSFLVSLSSTTSPNSKELVHYDTGTGDTRGPFQSVTCEPSFPHWWFTYPQCSPSGTGRTKSGTSRITTHLSHLRKKPKWGTYMTPFWTLKRKRSLKVELTIWRTKDAN